MDERQNESLLRYAEILKGEDVDLAVAVGRHSEHLGVGSAIWADIKSKISLKEGMTLIDIGCGCGEVTEQCLKDASEYGFKLHLVDIPEALSRVKREMAGLIPNSTLFWDKPFPQVIAERSFPKKVDVVLAYSVLHYTDQPEVFIDVAVNLLEEGGVLLLGDLPTVHKKGRFLSSRTGREFEAEYQGVTVNELPKYKDQFDYYDKCENQNKKINDELIMYVMNKYRAEGYDVFCLPQADGLPFCRTREDILICRK